VPESLKETALQLVRNRAAFSASITTPMLLWLAPSEPHPEEAWEHTDSGMDREVRPRTGNPLVFRVEKRPGAHNAFPMAVTIGRIDSNDVQIDDVSVSRFHCYLQRDAKTGVWFLTDAESNHGTFVDGVKLTAKQKVPLRDDTRVRVGEVELRFFSAAAFLKYLEVPDS
jgi:hypothetical protein